MVAAVASEPAVEKVTYKSPKHAQVWFLRRSRDLWKKKYQALKVEAKRWQNRVADVTKSRDKWRTQAEDAQRRLAVTATALASSICSSAWFRRAASPCAAPVVSCKSSSPAWAGPARFPIGPRAGFGYSVLVSPACARPRSKPTTGP